MEQHFLEELLANNLSGIKQRYQEDQCSGRPTQLKVWLRKLVKEEQTRLIQGALEPRGRFEVFVKTYSCKVNEADKLGQLIKENPNKKN